MVFSSNPLSLSVPEPAFESWLRESGYLEILDQRTSDLHRLSSTATATASDGDAATDITTAAITTGFFYCLFSYFGTLFSLFTFNPFSKLTTEDFSGETPSWTLGFLGFCDSYSFPSSPSQARLRVHENVKRYARNYASLFILAFACSLYQMPLALVGLISSLALWDLFRFCSERWGLDRYTKIRQVLVRIAQCATAVILFCTNVQMALFCALGVSYAVMILHASFRKLTPAKQPTRGRWKWLQQSMQRSGENLTIGRRFIFLLPGKSLHPTTMAVGEPVLASDSLCVFRRSPLSPVMLSLSPAKLALSLSLSLCRTKLACRNNLQNSFDLRL